MPEPSRVTTRSSMRRAGPTSFATSSGERVVKEKAVERGICLLMRREILAGCVPFPTDTALDFDWQIGQRHANSIEALGLKMLAVDNVVHIGIYDSTWHPVGVPADARQLAGDRFTADGPQPDVARATAADGALPQSLWAGAAERTLIGVIAASALDQRTFEIARAGDRTHAGQDRAGRALRHRGDAGRLRRCSARMCGRSSVRG